MLVRARSLDRRRATGSALLALVMLMASLAISVVTADAVPLTAGVIGGFQQDGNEILDVASGTLDWATLTAAPAGTLTVVTDDTVDSGFTGSKELEPSTWKCASGGDDPAKSDTLKAFVNPRISPAGVFLDLAFIRKVGEDANGKGDVHVNFEFNNVAAPPAAPFVAGPCGLARATGDLLVSYDFPGGSSSPSINVYRWDALAPVTGNAEGDWIIEAVNASWVAGAVNAGPIADPVGAYGTLGPQRFGEASLELTQILNPNPAQPKCTVYRSTNIRSRSSGESWTSALQDKLPSTPINFSTCGGINLVKRGDDGQLLTGAKFKLFSDPAGNGLGAGDPQVGPECTTDAQGACAWGGLVPGIYFVTETAPPAGYSLDDDPVVGPINVGFGQTVHIDGTTDVDGVAGLDSFVNYKWRYTLNLSPDASNLVGTDHIFTATLLVQKTAAGAPVAAAGETLALSLAGPGSILTPGSTCVTNGAGQCAITIHSNAAGDSTLSASYNDTVTAVPVDAADSAVKHWINYGIDITPDATNRVGSDHLFTVTVTRDSGSGFGPLAGAHPTVTKLSGPGTLSPGTCLSPGTDASGQCTITLSSAATGTTVVEASYLAVEETTNATFAKTATKEWVDYDLTVDPDGVNHAGDDHTFTVHLFQLVGGQPVDLAGEVVTLRWDGDGSIPDTTCRTDLDGECAVVASSAAAGHGTLTAHWGINLDSGRFELEDSAEKTWIDWDLTISPDNKTNLIGTDHTFTVTVWRDSGDGAGLQRLAGADPAITLDGEGAIVAGGNTCSGGTAADGTCTVTITSAQAGDTTVTAAWEAIDGASGVTEDLSASAVKHWVDYQIDVEEDAVNRVGDDHVFIVTLLRDSGDDLAALPGAEVDLSWSGGNGSAISAVSPGPSPLDSCTTDAAGQCRVTVSSSAGVAGDLTATYGVVLDSGTHSFSANANKRWVDWGLSITPQEAENLVGTSHTFVVTVTHDTGDGHGLQPLEGAEPAIELTGPGAVTDNTCAEGTGAAGTCTVTITSAVPGTSTVSAAFEAALDQASVSLEAQGHKLWVDYRLVVSPKTAVNPINTTHTFTVTLEKDTGSGFAPAPAEGVDLALTGPGSITVVDAGTIGSGSAAGCTTDEAGTCRVTITSPVAGTATLHATFGAEVGDTFRTFTDSGDKLWEVPVVPPVPPVPPTPEVPVVPAATEPLSQTLSAGDATQPAAPATPATPAPAATNPPQPTLTAGEELPRTGAGIAGEAWLAVSLLGAGTAIRLAGRRRRNEQPAG